MIRTLVVDDQPLVRAGLRTLLDRGDDITVVAEATDGADAVRKCAEFRPDVVLMDVRMPGTDGIAATRLITEDAVLQAVRVLILTTFDTEEHIFDAIAAGASGFLLKDSSPDELRHAVRVVAGGDALLSPTVTTRVLGRLSALPARRTRVDDATLGDLTEREREVLGEVGKGLSNDQIAEVLYISPATARTYVSRLLGKLGARDRAGLVVIAYEAGLRG